MLGAGTPHQTALAVSPGGLSTHAGAEVLSVNWTHPATHVDVCGKSAASNIKDAWRILVIHFVDISVGFGSLPQLSRHGLSAFAPWACRRVAFRQRSRAPRRRRKQRSAWARGRA